jgi:AcrR family transcriptional regulator
MATRTRNTERREDALSRERIVDAAVEMLDAIGESGLTFRALTTRLKTGPGAVYWHVANKNELLAAATEAVLAGALAPDAARAATAATAGDTAAATAGDTAAATAGDAAAAAGDAAGDAGETPENAVRALAIGAFDAIDAHPWIGTQLARDPSQPAMLRLFERIGQQVQALGVPAAAQFDSASALLNYILGVAGQNAANARAQKPGTNRTHLLGNLAAVWAGLDPDQYPFTRNVAGQLRDHDDREQFLAGIDLILAGIANRRHP